VSLYWRCLDPLEPLLDQGSFGAAYQALFDGSEMECDEQIFLCTLNLVFALSTQLQESTPSEQRNGASKTFFLRAWHLLRPEVILWQAGSLEIVPCLLLMTKYLQCTPNLQQTWMALGSAVRIALSIGLDHPERNLSGSDRENQLAQDVWQQCAFMDRYGEVFHVCRPRPPLIIPQKPLLVAWAALHGTSCTHSILGPTSKW
jgi:hypothetical protein